MSVGCSVPSVSGWGDVLRSGALPGLNWARLGKKVGGQHVELLTKVPDRDLQLQLRGAGSVAPWICFSQLLRCWHSALNTTHLQYRGSEFHRWGFYSYLQNVPLLNIFLPFQKLPCFLDTSLSPFWCFTSYWHRTLICVSHVDFSHRAFLFTQPQGDSASLNLSCTSPIFHSQRSSFHNLQGHVCINHYLTFWLLWS